MNVKTLGADINKVIEDILIKRTSFDTLVEKLSSISSSKIEELETMISDIDKTSKNLNLFLYRIENVYSEIHSTVKPYLDDKRFYNEVLPYLKDKFMEIFESYLGIFTQYEQEIKTYITDLIDKNYQTSTNDETRSYTYNIYNIEQIKLDENLLNKINYFFQTPANMNPWYSGKFTDEYLKKEVKGSLEIFHVKNNRDSKMFDYIGNNANPIYENIMYHPDYGMIYYRSSGTADHNTNYYESQSKTRNINYEVICDDGFAGEFVETKGFSNTYYNKDKFQEIQASHGFHKIPFHMKYTHIATNKNVADRTNLEEKPFIHKVRCIESKSSYLPSLFYIGQNKERDSSITKDYTGADLSTQTAYLNTSRSNSSTNQGDIYINNDHIIEFENDNKETLTKNHFLRPSIVSDALGILKGSRYFLNYRNRKVTLLHEVYNKNSDSYTVTNYDYSVMPKTKIEPVGAYFGQKFNVIATSIRAGSKKDNAIDLFSLWVPRLWNFTDLDYSYAKHPSVKTFRISNSKCFVPIDIGYVSDTQKLMGVYPYADSGIASDLSIPNSCRRNTGNLSHKTMKNDYKRDFDMPENLWPDQVYEEYFDICIGFENVFNSDYWYYQQSFDTKKYVQFDKSLYLYESKLNIMNNSLNDLNKAKILQKDLDLITAQVIDELFAENLEEAPIGTIKYIPYSIDNPKYIFDGHYARAGSVLSIKKYPEAYKIFSKYQYGTDNIYFDSSSEFMVPNLFDTYVIGAESEDTLLQTGTDSLPRFNLEIIFDTDLDPEKKYTGVLSTSNNEDEYTRGVNTGQFGTGARLYEMEINHKSTSPVTKGDDFRLDVYIKVK